MSTLAVEKATATQVVESATKNVSPNQAMEDQMNSEETDIRPKWIIFLESIPQWQTILATIALGIFSILSSIGSIMSACSARDSADIAKETLKIYKESLLPKIDIYTENRSFNNNVDVTKPEIIVKNFGNIAVKDVKISARADLRYADIPDDSISSFTVVNRSLGNFDVGNEKRVKINLPDIFQDAIKGEDTRILFLHSKIIFVAFDEIVESPAIGLKFIRAGENTRYEECEHNN